MSILNPSYLQQSLLLAGTLSLYSGVAQAQTVTPGKTVVADGGVEGDGGKAANPEGRAGVATLCIEKRSYVDPVSKKIITPTIYIDVMPKEGIDTGYVPGNAVAKQWEDFLNPKDEERKKWLEDTDIPDQAKEAIDLVKRLDKNKDGIISVDEFEEGEKGKSLEDKKIDLAFLTSLRCDNLFFTEGPTNSVDVEKFPDVIALRKDLGDTKDSLSSLEKNHTATLSDLDAERTKSKNFLYATIGLGGLGLLLGVGLVVALRRKKGGDPTPAKSPATPPKIPGGGSGGGGGVSSGPKVEVTINNASPAKAEVKTEAAYDDVLQNLVDPKNAENLNENVLKALEEGEAEKKTSNNPFHEIMTYSVDDTAIAKALSKVDPALVEFYRTNISNDASRVTTFSDLLARIAIEDPGALSAVQAAIAVEGRPATEMAERYIFELIARAADWKPADAAARSSLVGKFEADVRAEHGTKPGESSDAAEKAKREAEEAKSKTKVLEKK